MKIFPIVILCCGSFVSAAAQVVSVGVKGGVPVTDALETFRGNTAGYFTHTKRYTITAIKATFSWVSRFER
jgi:hypothetical protein